MTVSSMTISAWQGNNPLREHRARKKQSRESVAAAISVSSTAVMKWENGTMIPSDDNMTAIAQLMGVGRRTLYARWNKWREDRPKLV